MSYQKYSRAEKEQICTLINKGHSVKELSQNLSISASNIHSISKKNHPTYLVTETVLKPKIKLSEYS